MREQISITSSSSSAEGNGPEDSLRWCFAAGVERIVDILLAGVRGVGGYDGASLISPDLGVWTCREGERATVMTDA